MSFVSAAFVLFMSVVGALYFLVPERRRWVVLLVASYVFYWLYSEWMVLVMFGQTLLTWLCASGMAAVERKSEDAGAGSGAAPGRRAVKAQRKRLMLCGVAGNVAALLFLKYWNFFSGGANRLLSLVGVELPGLDLLLPVGISFYTLQAIAYLVDVYRGKVAADRSLPKFMLFMSYFPQILQGPIPRYGQLARQLYEGHRFDYERLCLGAQLILWGFIKKLVIADRLAIPVNLVFDNYTYFSGPLVLLAAAGYGLQVYADFSGGVDIARGFSQCLGISLADNFRQPYFSKSIEEFWRRWHITLGAWMRDYVFYPLSLSKAFARLGKRARKLLGSSVGKKIPPFAAMFIVYFLVGFWHGPNWKYIAYGVWNGVFISVGILMAERYASMRARLRVDDGLLGWRFFQMLRTFVICAFGRFFSRAASLKQALAMMAASFAGWYDLSFVTDGTLVNLGLSVAEWVVLLVSVAVLLVVGIAHERGKGIREAIARQHITVRWAIYLTAFSIPLVFGVYGLEFDSASFIYQQF